MAREGTNSQNKNVPLGWPIWGTWFDLSSDCFQNLDVLLLVLDSSLRPAEDLWNRRRCWYVTHVQEECETLKPNQAFVGCDAE